VLWNNPLVCTESSRHEPDPHGNEDVHSSATDDVDRILPAGGSKRWLVRDFEHDAGLMSFTVPEDVAAHIPDIRTQDGLLDVIMVGSLIELAEIINRSHYEKTETDQEREEENVMRWRYRLFIKWFVSNYTTRLDNELVNPTYVFYKHFLQVAAALVIYMKQCPKVTGLSNISPLQVQSDISRRIRRSNPELFAAFTRLLATGPSSFGWTGPAIEISSRGIGQPISSDPKDIASHPLYTELWETEEKSSDDDDDDGETDSDDEDMSKRDAGQGGDKQRDPDDDESSDNDGAGNADADDDADAEKRMDVDEQQQETPDRHEEASVQRHLNLETRATPLRSRLRKRERRGQNETNNNGKSFFLFLYYFFVYLSSLRYLSAIEKEKTSRLN
jgi:hypothetical protein